MFHLGSQSTSDDQRTELMIANRVRFADRTGTPTQRLLFRLYFVLGWLPAYTLARLVPRFGVRVGAGIAFRMFVLATRRPASGCANRRPTSGSFDRHTEANEGRGRGRLSRMSARW